MNAKFFDLKKEKQDRMINAALKSFAQQGYLHAGTDVIARNAGISKGLLFHYFESKIGLYTFVYEYSVRYMLLELAAVSKSERNLFELMRQVETAHVRVMREYPYMVQFLNRSVYEDVGEALVSAEKFKTEWENTYENIYRCADYRGFSSAADGKKMRKIMEYTVKGMMTERIFDASFQPDMFYTEISGYIDMMEKLTER